MRTYMVECYWPGEIEQTAAEDVRRLARVAAAAAPGTVVRFLGCVLVPADGMALLLFTASSEDIVRRIGRQSELPFDRIVDSIHIGFDEAPACKTARI